jgi:hypothetical protein
MATPPPRQAVLIANQALKTSTAIGVTVMGTVLLLSLISFYEHRNEIDLGRAITRWRIPLLGAVTFSFIVCLIDGLSAWMFWSPGQGCEVFGILITLFYVIEKQFLNLFLVSTKSN